ncbi:hypothetical protein HUT06_39505 [Actinomadura sp. NAK00032]|uniref:hypothetical protein n=1 Tax=Actinomadura sp. NAK00032 TaxID=2742128 RepID=UPI0015902D22|nr:hypothetical protein [Actinomadura sp. NAK00032]QKW39372.1 hypothetical protein HUT06_39505 [Actinomadura sp. NAK00032]
MKDAKPIYSITGGEWGSEVDVTLWSGMGPEGFRHYWAPLAGKTRPGDAVWMDVLIHGAGWHQCGPFGVGSNGQEISSPMGRVTHFSAFRACGRHNNSSGCTSDYYTCCSRHTHHPTLPQQESTPPRD